MGRGAYRKCKREYLTSNYGRSVLGSIKADLSKWRTCLPYFRDVQDTHNSAYRRYQDVHVSMYNCKHMSELLFTHAIRDRKRWIFYSRKTSTFTREGRVLWLENFFSEFLCQNMYFPNRQMRVQYRRWHVDSNFQFSICYYMTAPPVTIFRKYRKFRAVKIAQMC